MTKSPQTSQPALVVENVSATYPGYAEPAVRDVSFEVAAGSMTVLIGPNGSGKSTVIKAILGLIEFNGSIKILGQPLNKVGHLVGYVPQRPKFDLRFPITVHEFIDLAKHAAAESYSTNEVLKMVSAEELHSKPLADLSGGQLQRVLLARALVNKPKLLILDEPEAGVDVGGEQTFYDLMEELVKKQQLSAVIASHELDIVYTYADQVVCLNQEMICAGKPEKILDQKTFSKLYGRELKFYGHHQTHHHHHE